MGNGTYTTCTYDTAGQLLHLVNYAPGGSVNSRFDYTYDGLGRRITETTLDGGWAYSYDAIGELTHAVFVSNDPGMVSNQDLQYLYDAVGNRTSTIINGATTAYTTNNLNEYVSVGTTAYGYDADGNLTVKTTNSGSTIYNYNDENRLTGVFGPDLNEAINLDPFGNINSIIVNGRQTTNLIDPAGPENVVSQYDGTGALIAHYIQGLGFVGRVDAGDRAAFYDFDGIGSTVGLTGGTGNYLNTYRYLPFGETTVVSGSLQNPFTFVGLYGVINDGTTTFSMRNRNYDPNIGQFLSNDPLNAVGGLNLRQYTGNGPTDRIDPFGLYYVDIGVSGGVWVGGTFGVQIGTGGVFVYVGAGVTTPGIGGSIQFSPNKPSPGWGGQFQGALGTGSVGPAGTATFGPGGFTGGSVGVGGGLFGSKTTGFGAYGTYTFGPFFTPPPTIPPPTPPSNPPLPVFFEDL
jgi:RHS repeat-associated protein